MRVLVLRCLSAVVAAGIPAQAVHLVGPGGFAQIRDALTAAGPGDHILVLPGTYAHFEAASGVTIRALIPGTVNVSWDPAYMPAGCATNIFCLIQEGRSVLSAPPGQALTLIDLTFPDTFVNLNGVHIPSRVEIIGGRVVLEDCTVRAFDVPALSVSNASVHLIRGVVGGTGFNFTAHGLRASTSTITAVGTRFTGNVPSLRPGGLGIDLANSRLVASHITAVGGFQSLGGPGSPAIRAGGGELWISDSVVQGGTGSICAVEALGTAGRFSRSTVTPIGGGCVMPGTGQLLGVEQLSPVVGGQLFTATWRTAPAGPVALFASFGLADVAVPQIEQPWFGPATAQLLGVFVADAAGNLAVTAMVPNATWFSGGSLYLHAIAGTSLPLSAAPPIGGVVR